MSPDSEVARPVGPPPQKMTGQEEFRPPAADEGRAHSGRTPAMFRADMEAAREIHDELARFIKNLTPGNDFGISHKRGCSRGAYNGPERCPKCQRKPELWLPGAEKITVFSGCRYGEPCTDVATMEAVKLEQPWFAVRVDLISNRTGEIVGHGVGARRLSQNGGDPNAAWKMAAKSARIDAPKNTFALSGIFTQDVPPSESVATTPDPDAEPISGDGYKAKLKRAAKALVSAGIPREGVKELLGALVATHGVKQAWFIIRKDFRHAVKTEAPKEGPDRVTFMVRWLAARVNPTPQPTTGPKE